MITYTVAFATALLLSTALTPLVRTGALRLGLFDAVSLRKVHTAPIPRLGGVAIVVAFYAPFLGLALYRNGAHELLYGDRLRVVGFALGGLLIALLGLYDDIRGANARVKFACQFAVALMVYALGFQVHTLFNPLGGSLDLGWLALPFTLIWIVGVINAMNLIDGLDGLASGVAFFAVALNFVVAATRGDAMMCVLMAALAGAVLGFLIFNFNPASIFMGDTGSMFLGFILAASSLVTAQKGATAVSMLVPVLALGLPIMDTLLAMIRRFLMARPMFSADKEHIHHQLLKMGYTHRRAVLALYGICLFFGLAALGMTYANGPQSAVILALVSVVVVVLMNRLGYLTRERATEITAIRKKNQALRLAVTQAQAAMKVARSRAELWDAVRGAAVGLEVQLLELKLATPSGEDTFEVRLDMPRVDSVELSTPIESGGVAWGVLLARWVDRGEIGRDDELALALLADHLALALARCESDAPLLQLVRK
jgi:UDP-GlcNAc:undecaprenyl-phosphate GlcNAc-1-phosphate transferase